MDTYAVAFKFDHSNLAELKQRRKSSTLPAGVKIRDIYRVLGENRGGLIIEVDNHKSLSDLVKSWSDLLSVKVTPLRKVA